MQELPATALLGNRTQVIIGIVNAVIGTAITDLEINNDLLRPVKQVVAYPGPGRQADAVTRLHQKFIIPQNGA